MSQERLSKLWGWMRNYLVAILLVSMVFFSFIKVAVIGTGPTPQGPPMNYSLHKTQIELEWHKGTREGEIRLQVSVDEPNFEELMIDKVVGGTTHSLNDLEPGRTFYWRLVQNEKPSRVARFSTAPNAVKF